MTAGVHGKLYAGLRCACAALLLTGLVAPSHLHAQGGATVAGTVTDAQGLALPGATVELAHDGR